jgi:hypothetical protein
MADQEETPDQHAERHREMVARWGKPEQVDSAWALGLIGSVGAGISPDQVIAFRYRDREAAAAYAAGNARHNDIRELGTSDDGLIAVLDLRGQL